MLSADLAPLSRPRRFGPFPQALVAGYGLLLAAAGVVLAAVAGGATASRAVGIGCVVLGAGCVLLVTHGGHLPLSASRPARLASPASPETPSGGPVSTAAESPAGSEVLAAQLAAEFENLQRLLDETVGGNPAPPSCAAHPATCRDESRAGLTIDHSTLRAATIFFVVLVLCTAWCRSRRRGDGLASARDLL